MTNIAGDLKTIFDSQYGNNVFSTELHRYFLISNNFLPRNGKTQTNSLLVTVQSNNTKQVLIILKQQYETTEYETTGNNAK